MAGDAVPETTECPGCGAGLASGQYHRNDCPVVAAMPMTTTAVSTQTTVDGNVLDLLRSGRVWTIDHKMEPRDLIREAADEIERLRHDLDLARIFMRNIRDNAKDSDALSPDQARWKLKVIHGMLEGWA